MIKATIRSSIATYFFWHCWCFAVKIKITKTTEMLPANIKAAAVKIPVEKPFYMLKFINFQKS